MTWTMMGRLGFLVTDPLPESVSWVYLGGFQDPVV